MNRLNNLFPDDNTIDKVIEYKKNNTIPSDIVSPTRFKKKYYNFIIKDNHLFYKPLQLTVIKKDEIANVLDKLYKDNNAIGKGIVNFYKYVISKYINITRDEVSDFLNHQQNYQVSRKITHRINKPIVAKAPNQI